jgi:hypothetical protein
MGTIGMIAAAVAALGTNRLDVDAVRRDPAVAAYRFLEAVRTGDGKRATALLTA